MSFVIGDKNSDIGGGRAVGPFTMFGEAGCGVETEHAGEELPDSIFDNLDDASTLLGSKLAAGWDEPSLSETGRRVYHPPTERINERVLMFRRCPEASAGTSRSTGASSAIE